MGEQQLSIPTSVPVSVIYLYAFPMFIHHIQTISTNDVSKSAKAIKSAAGGGKLVSEPSYGADGCLSCVAEDPDEEVLIPLSRS